MEYEIAAHGSQYKIEADPESIVGRAVSEGSPYEPALLETIYHLVQNGQDGIALDIGAHIGNHSLWMAAVCKLDVVAWEPIYYDAFFKNILLNRLFPKIKINQTGLGSQIGVAEIAGKGRLAPAASTSEMPVQEGDWVSILPLDTFNIDLTDSIVKIDVEDMEPDVLVGGRETIERYKPIIFAEARDDECHGRVARILRPLGYKVERRFHRGTRMEMWAA